MDRVVLFGAGNNYLTNKERFETEYDVVGVVDNNYEVLGNDIKPAELLKSTTFDKVIITPTIHKEIYNQLLDMGIPKTKIVIDVLDSESCKKTIAKNTFWGQHADDLIVEAIFARIGIDKPTYLDLGCNLPALCNNTIAFYKVGSRGINVDANPEIIELVKSVRFEDVNLNVGVAPKEGTLTFYMIDNYCGLNSFSIDEINKSGMKITKTKEIPVVTLDSIITKYCPDGFPDFLDCDIEGLDYEVLESYDLKSNGPKVICVEVREKEIDKFDEMLDGKDYYRFCRIGENNIYVQKKYSGVVSHVHLGSIDV